ncbi:MAG: hypothetical protein COV35_07615 [Alphaproteobacteria bacterium CG11_big_fil_rev_8_21_14_0_20_39_49]|nr:MAG: hypothetical protein COV35_07615 [Alphaproteobacteria bacterium CG11_big_fil_rev_8_21_14_0_20_39_49]
MRHQSGTGFLGAENGILVPWKYLYKSKGKLVAGTRSRLESLFSCCVEVKEDKYSIFKPIRLNYNDIVHEVS